MLAPLGGDRAANLQRDGSTDWPGQGLHLDHFGSGLCLNLSAGESSRSDGDWWHGWHARGRARTHTQRGKACRHAERQCCTSKPARPPRIPALSLAHAAAQRPTLRCHLSDARVHLSSTPTLRPRRTMEPRVATFPGPASPPFLGPLGRPSSA